MRIELPSASWDHAALRADEDAHTLTVAAQPAADWMPLAPLNPEPGGALRAQVPDGVQVTLTLTF